MTAIVTGAWRLEIRTPIGTQHATVVFTDTDGELTGEASGRDTAETVPLSEVALDGTRLTWKQSITRPMRLHLVFDVTIDGNTLEGTSKAGRLPSSKVRGERV